MQGTPYTPSPDVYQTQENSLINNDTLSPLATRSQPTSRFFNRSLVLIGYSCAYSGIVRFKNIKLLIASETTTLHSRRLRHRPYRI